jgi:cytochrome c-type biogenesis protein CcmH
VTRSLTAAALAVALAGTAGTAARAAEPGVAPPTADPRGVVGDPAGQPLSGPALETATHEIASVIRCPVCQGLSVADSPTDLARNMKQQVRDLLAAGYDREQVLRYFESSYGEFVRLQPPLRGVNWLVWLAPVAGLLAGGFIVARSLRRPSAPAAAADPAGAVADVEEDDDLAPYVLRVRELAYGWPGGRRPESPETGKA